MDGSMLGVGLTVIGITLPTGGVIIAAMLKRRNGNSTPDSISERVCVARRNEIVTRLVGMEKNLSDKIGELQKDIQEIKEKI